jgi:hypothetical protein
MLTVLWLAIFRGFDARRAFLLPPRDIGAPERVRTETGQIAALDRCRPPRSLPDAGIPQRQGAAVRQGEDPLLRVRAFRRGLEAVAFNEISQRKRALPGLRFRIVDVIAPVALHDAADATLQDPHVAQFRTSVGRKIGNAG